MEFPVEATLNMKPFQDQKKVRHLLRSHGFTLTNIGGDEVRISGNFMELKVVKIHLEQLMATNTHQSSSSPVKELASGFTSSMDSKETFPPDQQGSVRSREEAIIVDADVFRYAEQLRKRELDEALKGHVRMHQQDTGESFAITLSGKNSREAGSKLKHFLADLNKFLRTQDILLKDLNPKGVDLSKKIGKSGIILGSNLVWFMGDRVHIIGPPKESFELKQELLVDQREHSGKPSGMDGRKRRNLSLQWRFRKNPKIDFQQVSTPAVDEASGFSSSRRVPADRHHSGKSSERDGRKKGSLSMCLPLEKKSRKDVREVFPPMEVKQWNSPHRAEFLLITATADLKGYKDPPRVTKDPRLKYLKNRKRKSISQNKETKLFIEFAQFSKNLSELNEHSVKVSHCNELTVRSILPSRSQIGIYSKVRM